MLRKRIRTTRCSDSGTARLSPPVNAIIFCLSLTRKGKNTRQAGVSQHEDRAFNPLSGLFIEVFAFCSQRDPKIPPKITRYTHERSVTYHDRALLLSILTTESSFIYECHDRQARSLLRTPHRQAALQSTNGETRRSPLRPPLAGCPRTQKATHHGCQSDRRHLHLRPPSIHQ